MQSSITRFADRADAGRKLAEALSKYKGDDVVVLALPRGGVPIGLEVANYLNAPLDLVIARKIGHPYSPEYAVAAVSEEGEVLYNEKEKRNLEPAWFETQIKEKLEEARRRRRLYLGERKPVSVEGKIAIVVDDGIATGLTLRVSLLAVKNRRPAKLVVAVPVAPLDTVARLKKEVDDVVVVHLPDNFLGAIGAYYDDFSQVSDEEVIAMMEGVSVG
ncbi:MAG TPA: phosphoribosyltransferase family protein [Verrucomicrobiae bacterium]|nr:phosphoribosyltransferase family protein [Verrucomicrobiae bacterium]